MYTANVVNKWPCHSPLLLTFTHQLSSPHSSSIATSLRSPGHHIHTDSHRLRRRCLRSSCPTESKLIMSSPHSSSHPHTLLYSCFDAPPPPQHKLVPWQPESPCTTAPTASICPRPSPRTRILTHVLQRSKSLRPHSEAIRSGWPSAAANPLCRLASCTHAHHHAHGQRHAVT